MTKERAIDYSGKRATVTWRGKLCIHIGECGRAQGDLFVTGRKPWCQPDLASDDEVTEVVLRCPSGALSVNYADGSHQETADVENTVHVTYNGPLFVRGELDIAGVDQDVPGLGFRAALCRCGQSKNKPFCDNSHDASGFRDYGAVGKTGDSAVGSGGPLKITPAQDGPLLLSGNVRLLNGSGRHAWQGTKVALCRCGASNNKPFCDGQHKKIGFTSG